MNILYYALSAGIGYFIGKTSNKVTEVKQDTLAATQQGAEAAAWATVIASAGPLAPVAAFDYFLYENL